MEQNITLILAPMAGFTDQPFRRICMSLGSDEVVTELLSANAIVRDNEKTFKLAEIHPEERPASVQIFGADPAVMAEAAKRVEYLRPKFIDINMGCPVKKVVKNGAGSALLQDPPGIGKIVKAVVNAVKTPVSVKIRTGRNHSAKTGWESALQAADNGAKRISVHARTVADMFSGPVDYEFVSDLKKRLDVEIIGNGGILSFGDAKVWMERTGADGLMVGRGAIGHPSVFRHIKDGVDGIHLEKPETVLRHLDLMAEYYGIEKVIGPARGHLMYYSKGFSAARRFRNMVNDAGTFEQLRDTVKSFFTDEMEKVA